MLDVQVLAKLADEAHSEIFRADADAKAAPVDERQEVIADSYIVEDDARGE